MSYYYKVDASNIQIRIVDKDIDLKKAFDIRQKVFVEEQGIPQELEYDEMDKSSIHVLAIYNGEILGTGRLTEDKNETGSISRIAVLIPHRGKGIGKLIVKSLEKIAEKNSVKNLRLEAHYYLEQFYENLGFIKIEGEEMVGKYRLINMIKYLR